MPFIAAAISLVATAFKSVGVNSGASRLRLRSCVFFAVSVVMGPPSHRVNLFLLQRETCFPASRDSCNRSPRSPVHVTEIHHFPDSGVADIFHQLVVDEALE